MTKLEGYVRTREAAIQADLSIRAVLELLKDGQLDGLETPLGYFVERESLADYIRWRATAMTQGRRRVRRLPEPTVFATPSEQEREGTSEPVRIAHDRATSDKEEAHD